jgi:hypothetical protein
MRRTAPLALLALLLAGCPGPTDWLDNGLMVRDGLELHQAALPVTVAVDMSVEDDTLVPEIIAWWNDQAGFEVFAGPVPVADILVTVGYVPGDYEDNVAGLAEVEFAADGSITSCLVTLSSDIAYHRPTLLKDGEHELGHCVGLEDDPGPPTTVDLRSIMSDPLDPLGRLTDNDRELLEEMR